MFNCSVVLQFEILLILSFLLLTFPLWPVGPCFAFEFQTLSAKVQKQPGLGFPVSCPSC